MLVLKRFFGLVVGHPWAVIAATALVTAAFGFGLPRLTKDDTTDKMLPDGDPVLRYTRSMEEVFASDEFIIVAVESPEPFSAPTVKKLVALTGELSAIPGVREVISPTSTKNVRGAAGEMSSEPLVNDEDPPATPERLQAYRAAIQGKKIFRGTIISESGRAFGLVLRLEKNPDKKAIVAAVQRVVDRNQGPETIYFSGSPAINLQVGKYMARDMARYFPLVIVLILFIFWLNFRSLGGAWLHFVTLVLPALWTLGLQGWLRVPISVIGTMIATLLIAVGSSYGIYVLTEYYEVVAGRADRREALVQTMLSIFPTLALAGTATVIGFASLVLNDTPILREFGWLTAFGVAASVIISLTFIPACLALMKTPAAAKKEQIRGGPLARFLPGVGRFNRGHRWVAPLVCAALLLASFAGYRRLYIETNAINFFKSNDPVRATIGKISNEFGGTITIRTVIEGPGPGSILRPEYLQQMADYQKFLEGFERVGKTLSIADLIKDMNRALHEGDPLYDALPGTLRAAEQYLFLYSLSAKPEEFESLIDSSHGMATVSARLRQVNARNEPLGTRETERILEQIQAYIATHFSPELKVTPTGRAQDIVRTSNYIVKGLIRSLVFSLVFIFLTAAVAFRSLMAGLFSIVTVAVAMALNFGVMGWGGIPLDIATTIISSIAIGIGVDNAMHYLVRFRRALRRTPADSAGAMVAAINEAGRAIIYTSAALIVGFLALTVASFRPVIYFGGLTALTFALTLSGALFVLPVLLVAFRPRFAAAGAPGPAAPAQIDNRAGRP